MRGYTFGELMKYFSYCPEEGFILHESADRARMWVIDAIDFERNEASEGWADYVDQFCWGEVKQHVVETMNRPRTDDDTFISHDCDTVVDYSLVDV
jgi:hypothetical protein